MYADYMYYRCTYRGNEIAEGDFPRLSVRALSYLDSICNVKGRAGDDAVKMAACAVAEAWQKNGPGEVLSESVGSWSRTFSSGGKTLEQALFDAAYLYLGPAGLLRAVDWA